MASELTPLNNYILWQSYNYLKPGPVVTYLNMKRFRHKTYKSQVFVNKVLI